MIVKIIKNDLEYQEALEQLSILVQKPHDPNSEIADTIELLLLVIKDFEQKHIEIIEVDPIEAILFRMDQMGLKQKDLKPYLGSASKISEVLNRKRTLSLSMIRKLHEGLGIPLNSLIAENKMVSLNAERMDYTQYPLKEMQDRGYFSGVKKSVNELKEYAEELINEFCGGYRPLLEQNIALLRSPLHVRGKKNINPYALAIWQICVIKKAETYSELPNFDKKALDKNWLFELVKLSQYSDGCRRAKEYLAKYGIALIIEPHFEKTFLDGAAIMYNKRPIIALTLRHNRIDNFWFVLIHELAHLIHHIDKTKVQFFIDDLDFTKELDELEIEADSIANETLIPSKIWECSNLSKTSTYNDVKSFAEKNHISPAIVAGRIRHCQNNYKLFPKLVNNPVNL